MGDRPAIPVGTRKAVLARQDGRCGHCQEVLAEPEFHHLVPWEQSRDHSAGNLVALCGACHRQITFGRGVGSNHMIAKAKRIAEKEYLRHITQANKRPGERRQRKNTIPSRGFDKR